MAAEPDAAEAMRAAFAGYLLLHGDTEALAPFPVGHLKDLWGLWEAAWRGGALEGRAAGAAGTPDAAWIATLIADEVGGLRGAADPRPVAVRLGADNKDAIERCHVRTGYSRSEVVRLFLRIGMRYADAVPVKPYRVYAPRPRPGPGGEREPPGPVTGAHEDAAAVDAPAEPPPGTPASGPAALRAVRGGGSDAPPGADEVLGAPVREGGPFVERMEEWRRSLGWSHGRFAGHLEISRQFWHQLRTRKQPLTLRVAQRVLRERPELEHFLGAAVLERPRGRPRWLRAESSAGR